jgi:hypothetical protein
MLVEEFVALTSYVNKYSGRVFPPALYGLNSTAQENMNSSPDGIVKGCVL